MNEVGTSETKPSQARRAFAWFQQQGENYRLTRFMLLRFTGLVYFIAFLSAAQQFPALVGHDGLLPADLMVKRVLERFDSPWDVFWESPSLFWFDCSDGMIGWVTWTGVVISFAVVCGFANAIMMFVLWALYFSLLPIGQEWLSYGWDIQILETGFLGMMLCPLLDPRPFPRRAPPVLIIWLYRWLIFRIMRGAGLIKWRGDECWRDLTALYYHYETQPVPNPLGPLLHFMPKWFHQAGVAWNHIVELIVPWFGFLGRWPRRLLGLRWERFRGQEVAWGVFLCPRHIAGFLMLSFQIILIFSGNLSFLNWLTIIPCLACFDDAFWKRVLPRFLVRMADKSAAEATPPSLSHHIATVIYTGVVIWLSIGPVKNLISSEQAMNTSFDRLHLVNTYGAFGTVDRERFELVFEGTTDNVAGPLSDWREYEFKAKPTDVTRRPVIITPYHYRLDWAAWYPWHCVGGRNQWVPTFLWKLLHNDPATLSLLARNPFPDAPPKFIRVLVYRYQYAPRDNKDDAWWVRVRVGVHIPALSLDSANLRQAVGELTWEQN
ncbi:MAG: lipase maturation factor family protein [Verrucomicrobiaceae bacterium]|nr:lipase maturation factor family protein [Verrucomicrobiaceae bacterium]